MTLPDRPVREPAINVPAVVLVLIAMLVVVHVWRYFASDAANLELLREYAFVPARVSIWLGWSTTEGLLDEIARGEQQIAVLQLAHYLLADGEAKPWTLVTYALLHADFTHLAVNSVWLLAFGGAVARRLEITRFLAFVVFCTVAAALAQWIGDPTSAEPVIGASGTISGMMGAALRFMFRDEIRLGPGAERFAKLPRLSVVQAFRDRRVAAFVLMLLGVNILFAAGFQLLAPDGARIAWQAHVGGFAAGLLAFALFDPVPRQQ